MSNNNPVVAITGASGSGTTVVKKAFIDIFHREGISAAYVDGECFRRYDRTEMTAVIEKAKLDGEVLSPYGPHVNRFDELESVFETSYRTAPSA